MSISSGITVRSEVPDGYDIGEFHDDVPIFSCPHTGCDGMVFDTVEQCKNHEMNYHEDPYMCACGEEFASRPSLQRHIRASWHREVNPERFSCVEECCPRYDEPLNTLHNLSGHNRSAMHRAAEGRSSYFQKILEQVAKDLNRRVLAFRSMICDVPSCPDFDRQWNSPASFLKHIKSDLHTAYDERFEKAMTSGPTRLENQEKTSWIFQCLREGCDEYQQRFRTNLEYRGHCASVSHIEAKKEAASRLQTPDMELPQKDGHASGLLSPAVTEPSQTPRKQHVVVIDLAATPKRLRNDED